MKGGDGVNVDMGEGDGSSVVPVAPLEVRDGGEIVDDVVSKGPHDEDDRGSGGGNDKANKVVVKTKRF